MCQNANKTVGSLMAAIEPTLKGFLQYIEEAATPLGQSVISAFDAALAAVNAWKSGTVAQDVLQALSAFQSVYNTLPIPAGAIMLGNIILAGIETVIGVLTANSPAPVAAGTANEETQAMYQAHVVLETEAKVRALVPTFKRSFFHTAAGQYKKVWNEEVQIEGLPDVLKV